MPESVLWAEAEDDIFVGFPLLMGQTLPTCALETVGLERLTSAWGISVLFCWQ